MGDKRKPVTMWFIVYERGIYQGGWYNRRQAVSDHCTATGRSWDYCRKVRGDRAVKCKVVPNAK